MTIDAINPSTGKTLRSYQEHSPEQVERALRDAHQAHLAWRGVSFAERSARMRAAAGELRRELEPLARLMADEMGKPLAQGRGEIEKCAAGCEYYAEHAEAHLAPEPVATDAAKSYIAYEPLGVVLAIMPWNFPFWQVFRFAAPALMAGNAAVLKHAANVPGCALAIERMFAQAGIPAGLFRTLLISSDRVGALIDHPLIKAVTLTGGTPAGKAVASRAGQALKKTVLELGGSDPYVVLEDADLEQAAQACASSRLINSGQSCIAAKRFIVVEPVRKRFEALLVKRMQAKRMGDPLQEGTEVGPLARQDLRDGLHEQVQRSVQQGATLLLGGTKPEGPGAFYPPTVLTNVTKGNEAFDNETFGPVAAIVPVKDEAEAIRMANNSIYGLGAAVFTRDLAKGERIAARLLEAGSCFVNTYVRSDPRLPFGGIKASGYGRELSRAGIREFVNIKTVYIA